jgi:uncharacterized protein
MYRREQIDAMIRVDMVRLGEICRRHDVARLRLFGSTARGEERPESDIDLLVDFVSPKGLFELLRLEHELESFFGRPVDLLTEEGLSPFLRAAIRASAVLLVDAAA